MITTKHVEYHEGDMSFNGFCAFPENMTEKRPAVLVVHDWSGLNDFAKKKAEKLAELGYVGFAVDMYGKGQVGNTKEEKSALMQPLMQDRAMLIRRMIAAFVVAQQMDQVDASKMGAIGFCFGGLCALDLARSGADVKGVVSFHGLLGAPEGLPQHPVKSKVLALHGYDDPMVTMDQVKAFANEMTHATVDWQLHMYGNTMHAFTNPAAQDPAFGTVYNSQADARAWIAMENFFRELLL